MTKVAIGSWAFLFGPFASAPTAFDEVAERVAGLGYDGLEVGAWYPHPTPESRPAAEIRDLLDRHGLAVSAVAGDFLGTSPLRDSSAYVARFRDLASYAVELGAGKVRVDTIEPPRPGLDGKRPRLVTAFRECAAVAAERGIRVVWEFEPGFAFNTPDEIAAVAADVDHPAFAVLYDSCHAHLVAKDVLPGGAAELARRLAGRIGHVHLIDSDGTLHDGVTSEHVPLGKGELDFGPILAALTEAGAPEDWWCVDLCFRADAWEEAGRCLDYVKDLGRRRRDGACVDPDR